MKKYKTILADPPWSFNDRLDKSRRLPYRVLTTTDLLLLPIEDIADEEAHLYLWVPLTLIYEGIDVMSLWGFDYKLFIVWNKLTKHRKRWFGLGHYFRNCVEVCLFGTRKNLKTRTNNTRNSFEAIKPDRHHSAKPDEFYDIYIELNSYSPFLELFATQKREGWTSVGYEIDGKDIRNVLEEMIKNE